MKFLSDHDETRRHLRKWGNQEVILIAFFFWAAGSELEKSYLELLRSLTYQLLSALPDLIGILFPERWKTLARGETYRIPWTEKELVKRITQLLRVHPAKKRFCFLIDGLDEFAGDYRDLMDAISALNESPTIKVCVSSRPWSLLWQTYGSNHNLHVAAHELFRRDIDLYIRTREIYTGGVLNHGELRQLGNAVRARSEGVLLWVTLAVGGLRRVIDERDDIEKLQRRLER